MSVPSSLGSTDLHLSCLVPVCGEADWEVSHGQDALNCSEVCFSCALAVDTSVVLESWSRDGNMARG